MIYMINNNKYNNSPVTLAYYMTLISVNAELWLKFFRFNYKEFFMYFIVVCNIDKSSYSWLFFIVQHVGMRIRILNLIIGYMCLNPQYALVDSWLFFFNDREISKFLNFVSDLHHYIVLANEKKKSINYTKWCY